MKKFLLLLIIPFFSFAQSGDTNGDGFVNLEDLFNVLENWLQNVNDNDPEAISNLDEMTSLVDSLITLNQNINYGRGYDMFFPDGYDGEGVTVNICDSDYSVPEGKTLYITNFTNEGFLAVNGYNILTTGYYRVSPTLPVIAEAEDIISGNSCIGNCDSSSPGPCTFSGFLVENSSVTRILNNDIYTVPEGKRLFILNYFGSNVNNPLTIDDINVSPTNNYIGSSANLYSSTFSLPIIVNSNQTVDSGSGVFNGYLVDEDYFSSVSNSNSNDISEENTISTNSVPIGTINIWSADVAPEGWMLCDGSEINREEYVDLFTLIGINYGEGDGVTTFNVPNLSGRIPVGLDENASNISNGQQLGSSGGEETHTLTTDELPSSEANLNTFTYAGSNGTQQGILSTNNGYNPVTYNLSLPGGNQPHNNMQPYLILNYIIKVE